MGGYSMPPCILAGIPWHAHAAPRSPRHGHATPPVCRQRHRPGGAPPDPQSPVAVRTVRRDARTHPLIEADEPEYGGSRSGRSRPSRVARLIA